MDVRDRVTVLCRHIRQNDPSIEQVELAWLFTSLKGDEVDQLSNALLTSINNANSMINDGIIDYHQRHQNTSTTGAVQEVEEGEQRHNSNNNTGHVKTLILTRSVRDDPFVLRSLLENVIPHPACTIVDLRLGCNRLCDTHAMWLGQALRTNVNLRELRIRVNLITCHGAKYLFEGLANNDTLERLLFDENPIGSLLPMRIPHAHRMDDNNNIFPDHRNNNNDISSCYPSITEALQRSSLQVLDLSHCDIGDEWAIAIADGLAPLPRFDDDSKNSSSPDSFGGQRQQQLTSVPGVPTDQKNTCKLRELYLPRNRITDRGCYALAMSLRRNTSLTTLNLFSNAFSQEGANYFELSLHINYTIELLNVMNNNAQMINHHDDFGDPMSLQQIQQQQEQQQQQDDARHRPTTATHQERINEICASNRYCKEIFDRMKVEFSSIPTHVYPCVLEKISHKRDYVFQALKARPDICCPYDPMEQQKQQEQEQDERVSEEDVTRREDGEIVPTNEEQNDAVVVVVPAEAFVCPITNRKRPHDEEEKV